MKRNLLSIIFSLVAFATFAQEVKQLPPSNLQPGQKVNLNIRPWHTQNVPAVENPFSVPAPDFNPLLISPGVKITMGDEGLPIFFEGATSIAYKATDERSAATGAIQYMAALQPAGIRDAATEFVVKKVQTDERTGNFHVRLEQRFQGVPVFGAELIAHTQNGIFTSAAGRYAPTPQLQSVQPLITAQTAIQKAVAHIGAD